MPNSLVAGKMDKNPAVFLNQRQRIKNTVKQLLKWASLVVQCVTWTVRYNVTWTAMYNVLVVQCVTWTARSIALILAVTAAAATAAAVGIGVVAAGIICGRFGGVHA